METQRKHILGKESDTEAYFGKLNRANELTN